jgi:Tfp pilus assembly protein PilV
MRFIKLSGARDAQRGVSLIEALVAAALLGIGIVTGMTAWDTATLSSQKAVRQTWAQCIVRSELDAILSAQWSDNTYATPDPSVTVDVTLSPYGSRTSAGLEQLVTVTARDPASQQPIYRASILKVFALQGTKSMNDQAVTSDVSIGCPGP